MPERPALGRPASDSPAPDSPALGRTVRNGATCTGVGSVVERGRETGSFGRGGRGGGGGAERLGAAGTASTGLVGGPGAAMSCSPFKPRALG